VPQRALVRELGGVALPDLDALERELARYADGDRVRLRWSDLARPELAEESVLRVDRRWFAARRCRRDDAAGRFACRELPPPPPAAAAAPVSARLDVRAPGPGARLARSLVSVSFDVPFGIDGVHGAAFTGAGLVVDAERGLVLVDRDTVPVTLGDVEITFGGAVSVDGRVVALHPEHNLALVAYEPALLGETPVESAELRDEPLAPGDPVWLVTLTQRQQILARASAVERIDAPQLPLPRVPRFREANLDLIALTEVLPGVGGVLADGKGRVRALWASFSTEGDSGPTSFFAGIPADVALAWLAGMQEDGTPAWRALGVELAALSLADARERGLAPEQVAELAEHGEGEPRVLAVRRVRTESPAAAALRVGDLLVRVKGRPVTRFREVERAAQAERVALAVARGGVLHEVTLETVPADGEGTREALLWAGALLQAPPLELATQWGASRRGVYVAGSFRGTPAERHELRPTLRILAAGDASTPDLGAFRAAVAALRDGEIVRLRTVDLEGRVVPLAIELDLHDWPSVHLVRTPSGWERRAAGGEAP
jgi:S1-C subfamily serine protease